MYVVQVYFLFQKPDKKVQQEDYLLGKSIDSKYKEADKSSQDIIPAVARRVVGATSSDTQVDLARKLQEDPLLLIKERERAARAALLNNPLQRRRLTELLRKEQVRNNFQFICFATRPPANSGVVIKFLIFFQKQ